MKNNDLEFAEQIFNAVLQMVDEREKCIKQLKKLELTRTNIAKRIGCYRTKIYNSSELEKFVDYLCKNYSSTYNVKKDEDSHKEIRYLNEQLSIAKIIFIKCKQLEAENETLRRRLNEYKKEGPN
jgi:hypothetical protein